MGDSAVGSDGQTSTRGLWVSTEGSQLLLQPPHQDEVPNRSAKAGLLRLHAKHLGDLAKTQVVIQQV